jgi:type I restriction enzyme R subunit
MAGVQLTPTGPEAQAREGIDAALREAGWAVQDAAAANVSAARGVALREFRLAPGHGVADYLLFVDGEAVGALEAKKVGETLSGVEVQVGKYGAGLPAALDTRHRPLPFQYVSTGIETYFVNLLDPHPRSRSVFTVHRPETLAEWLKADSLPAWLESLRALGAQPAIAQPAIPHAIAEPAVAAVAPRDHTLPDTTVPYDPKPSTLSSRLRTLPRGEIPGLWPNQQRAIAGLERSLARDRQRQEPDRGG